MASPSIAVATQCAHYILSSGYMETPPAYIDHDEVKHALSHASIESKRIASTSTFTDVWNTLEMSSKLHLVDEIQAKSIDDIVAHLTITCSKHPTACIITSDSGDATCIAGYDGDPTSTKYATLDLSGSNLKTYNDEYSIQVSMKPNGGSKYTAYIVESSAYNAKSVAPNTKKLKTTVKQEKGKEEEVIVIEEEEEKVEEEVKKPRRTGRKSKR